MASVATLRDLLEALIESAKEVNKLQKVTSDLETFFKTISSHEDLKKILGSSVYEIEERKDIVGDICEKMGLDHLTLNFIKLIIELEKFKTLINSQEPVIRKLRKVSGTQRAEVTFPEPPRDSDLSKIKESLERLTGDEIELVVKVDPNILGGVIAKVEDKVFDGSIKNQLERIRGVLSVP
ncbi:ATP synthase F1 subunit delta [Desulfobacterota bacterium AH_259_B03_O07]|nr:ATP synthase F1 subunit delta [Desulfobacterota bacterium AH_259_B03_O07]